jgi:hypothetical protein
MGYTFLHYAEIIRRINGGFMEDVMSDYEMCQEDDIYLDMQEDDILDDPRHGQAYYLNEENY